MCVCVCVCVCVCHFYYFHTDKYTEHNKNTILQAKTAIYPLKAYHAHPHVNFDVIECSEQSSRQTIISQHHQHHHPLQQNKQYLREKMREWRGRWVEFERERECTYERECAYKRERTTQYPVTANVTKREQNSKNNQKNTQTNP